MKGKAYSQNPLKHLPASIVFGRIARKVVIAKFFVKVSSMNFFLILTSTAVVKLPKFRMNLRELNFICPLKSVKGMCCILHLCLFVFLLPFLMIDFSLGQIPEEWLRRNITCA